MLNSTLLERTGSTLRRTGFLQPLRSFEDMASESSSGAHTQNSCSARWAEQADFGFLLSSIEGAALILVGSEGG